MSSATETAQVRLNRTSPTYWRVVIDNPPLTLMGPAFVLQFRDILAAIETDERVRVVTFESAVEGYFLNHSDFLAKLEDLTNIPQGPTGLEAWPDILVRLTRAPVVSIAGGEPLIHKEMPEIVRGFVRRKKFVYLCTNALLLSRHMDDYIPSPYLTFSVHLDGNRERHDASVCRSGVFDQAVESIQKALQRRLRVTINCTLFQGESAQNVAAFLDDVMALGVEGVTISPGFNYQHAPQQDVFIQRNASKELFRSIFELGKNRAWRLNHSSLFLNFLAGNETYRCTPWGNPTRNVFGWQRPCYLLVDEGYAPTFKALMEETNWDRYGTGNNPKCANCMAHCGYEATAVNDAMGHPLKGLRVSLRGPKTEGPFAPELPTTY